MCIRLRQMSSEQLLELDSLHREVSWCGRRIDRQQGLLEASAQESTSWCRAGDLKPMSRE